jgi:hypothetical protein
MTVTLNLSSETVRRLREKAAQSGLTLETYLEQLAELSTPPSGNMIEAPAAEWIAAWRSWAAHRPASLTLADDSRESIYAGRGE